MSQKITGGLPDNLDLPSAWTIRFAALDPTTGAAVSGVSVSGASLIVTNVAGGDLTGSGFELVDLEWLNLPVDDTPAV